MTLCQHCSYVVILLVTSLAINKAGPTKPLEMWRSTQTLDSLDDGESDWFGVAREMAALLPPSDEHSVGMLDVIGPQLMKIQVENLVAIMRGEDAMGEAASGGTNGRDAALARRGLADQMILLKQALRSETNNIQTKQNNTRSNNALKQLRRYSEMTRETPKPQQGQEPRQPWLRTSRARHTQTSLPATSKYDEEMSSSLHVYRKSLDRLTTRQRRLCTSVCQGCEQWLSKRHHTACWSECPPIGGLTFEACLAVYSQLTE